MHGGDKWFFIAGTGGGGKGPAGPLGGLSLHKREGRERRGGHGVADPVPDGPLPPPPVLREDALIPP